MTTAWAPAAAQAICVAAAETVPGSLLQLHKVPRPDATAIWPACGPRAARMNTWLEMLIPGGAARLTGALQTSDSGSRPVGLNARAAPPAASIAATIRVEIRRIVRRGAMSGPPRRDDWVQDVK